MLAGDEALILARIQFAFTISFHFIFPAFSIGLASYLAVLEGLWLKTGKSLYRARSCLAIGSEVVRPPREARHRRCGAWMIGRLVSRRPR